MKKLLLVIVLFIPLAASAESADCLGSQNDNVARCYSESQKSQEPSNSRVIEHPSGDLNTTVIHEHRDYKADTLYNMDNDWPHHKKDSSGE